MSAPHGIVLGAGKGLRFGGPKVLAPWPIGDAFEPLGVAHLRARAKDCARVVLVARRGHVDELLLSRLPPRTALVCSDEPEDHGPAGSIAAALLHLSPRAGDWLLLTPVDLPPADLSVVAALLEAVAAHPGSAAARPRSGGRGGHPVLVRAELLVEAYRSGRPPLREVLAAPAVGLLDVAVEDPDVLRDFDAAADLATYLEVRARTTRT
ncbi:MAG: NTP transferase domain-containing protein [Deltaproteobacteria bacterium]|nr:NTP transferase domain-containing protein [Deltaproteobacteria bacterium]